MKITMDDLQNQLAATHVMGAHVPNPNSAQWPVTNDDT